MNKKVIQDSVKNMLRAIGEDPNRKDLKETPRRVAEMYEEIFSGVDKDPKKDLEVILDQKHDEIILLKGIPLYSVCEHHSAQTWSTAGCRAGYRDHHRRVKTGGGAGAADS